jgi:signal transduction histidine kinase
MGSRNSDPVFRVVATGASFVAYVALLVPLAGTVGAGALFLAIVPVLVTGWLDGLLMGLAMGLITAPVGALILAAGSLGTKPVTGNELTGAVVPAMLALALVGMVVGRLRDVSRRAGVQALMLLAESRRRQEAEGDARAAQEDERRRIAEDVHDDVVQVMTAVAVRLGLLRRRLEEPAQLAVADGALATVEQAIVRLRALIFDLSPPTLDRYGLAGAVRMKLQQFETEGGFRCQLQAEVKTEPEPDVRVLIYRVIQEALSNIRKHSQASKVVISISEDEAGVLVRVRDDGVGFSTTEAGAPKAGHLGFRTMRDRAQSAGGWLKTESTIGVGSTISLWVPNRPQGPRSMEPAQPQGVAVP